MGVPEAFFLGVVIGPVIWGIVVVLLKFLEDGCNFLERKWRRRKWDKNEKRKDKLERELKKLNEREY